MFTITDNSFILFGYLDRLSAGSLPQRLPDSAAAGASEVPQGERGRHRREALVYAYGGGLKPSSFRWVQQTYRSRFGIETRYRQMHQARIRTCTRGPLLRLLYVGIALVLRNVWV